MKQIILTFLMVLLLAGSLSAIDSPTEKFFEDVSGTISQQSSPFIQSTQVVGGTPKALYGSFYSAFQPGYCGPDQLVDPNDLAGSLSWYSMTGFAVLIVAFGVTLLYMLGQVLQSANLISVAKEEAWQAVVTIVRVVFIVGLIVGSNAWYQIQTSGSGDQIYGIQKEVTYPDGTTVQLPVSMIEGAMSISKFMVVEMITDYSNLVMYNMVIHTLYSSTMWFGVTWRAMYSFNLGPVLKPLIDIVGMALNFLSLGIGEWMLHIVLLCLIKKWTWALFVPVAIFMRTFPQTRGAGEALFAIVIALSIVYPFMFIATYETHKIMKGNLVDSKSAIGNFIQKSGILAVAGSVVVTMFLAAGVFFPFFVGMALNIAFELIRNAVYYVIIMSLLLPFLNIFVTLTAARETAKFFNVDISFMSFIKIV